MFEVTIREATVGDIPQIVRFTFALAKDMREKLNQKVVRGGVAQFIADKHHGQYFLAIQKNHVIGQIIIKPVIMEPWRKSHIIWVDDFYVDPDPVSTETMKALLRHGIHWALPREHEQVVRLFCPHNHPSMLHAVLCLGFEPIGIMMQQRQDYFFEYTQEKTEVREATLDDVDKLTRFTVDLATELGDHVNQKVIRDGITQFIRQGNYGKYFLAIVESKPAGQIIVKNTLLEPWRQSNIIWIDDAFVPDDFRGSGITRTLLQHGIEWGAAQEPEQIVRLYCAFQNHDGLKCWTGLGFEPIGYMMQQRQNVFL